MRGIKIIFHVIIFILLEVGFCNAQDNKSIREPFVEKAKPPEVKEIYEEVRASSGNKFVFTGIT